MKVGKYLVALFGMFLLALGLTQIHPDHQTPLTDDAHPRIWVLSDTHFIAPVCTMNAAPIPKSNDQPRVKIWIINQLLFMH